MLYYTGVTNWLISLSQNEKADSTLWGSVDPEYDDTGPAHPSTEEWPAGSPHLSSPQAAQLFSALNATNSRCWGFHLENFITQKDVCKALINQ